MTIAPEITDRANLLADYYRTIPADEAITDLCSRLAAGELLDTRLHAVLDQAVAALGTALHWARTTDDPHSVTGLGGCLDTLVTVAPMAGRDYRRTDFPHLETSS